MANIWYEKLKEKTEGSMMLTEAENHFYSTYDYLRTGILTSLCLGCDFYEGGCILVLLCHNNILTN